MFFVCLKTSFHLLYKFIGNLLNEKTKVFSSIRHRLRLKENYQAAFQEEYDRLLPSALNQPKKTLIVMSESLLIKHATITFPPCTLIVVVPVLDDVRIVTEIFCGAQGTSTDCSHQGHTLFGCVALSFHMHFPLDHTSMT